MRLLKRSHARFCSTKCRVASHRANAIPAEMRETDRWVNHDEAKRPLDPETLKSASVTTPHTWGSYESARANQKPIGYVLGRGIGCIDLDNCIKPDGTLTPAAQEIVDYYPENWIEISPSGTGLHIWGTAIEQKGFKRTWRGQTVEFYSRARYITITRRTYQRGKLAQL